MSSGRPSDRPPAPVLHKLVPVPSYRDRPATPASDLRGRDLQGGSREVPVLGTGNWTLLLFLSSGCQGCLDLWEATAEPTERGLVADERLVVLTHEPPYEDPEELVRLVAATKDMSAAAPAVEVLMSEQAWHAYRVQGPPFFVLVDGTRDQVVTEGVAWGVGQVAEHVRAARADARAS